jgi:hypothetical protein
MLIVAMEAEVTISGTGRILIKSPDPGVAARTFERVLDVIFAAPSTTSPARGPARSG